MGITRLDKSLTGEKNAHGGLSLTKVYKIVSCIQFCVNLPTNEKSTVTPLTFQIGFILNIETAKTPDDSGYAFDFFKFTSNWGSEEWCPYYFKFFEIRNKSGNSGHPLKSGAVMVEMHGLSSTHLQSLLLLKISFPAIKLFPAIRDFRSKSDKNGS